MALPCEAQINFYDAGGSVVEGPFDFDWDESRGLYTTGAGAEQTIQWNGVGWVYTDAFGDLYAGGSDADDPAGNYIDTSSGSSSAITITATTSGSTCDYSDSAGSFGGGGAEGDGVVGGGGEGEVGGSAKSSSSVSEGEGSP